MDIFEQFATDATRENEGTWVPYNDAKFLVARTSNPHYAKALTNLVDTNRILLDQKDAAADKLSTEILIDVLATTILLGWAGNVSYKGKKLPHTPANAKLLLSHKDFRILVAGWADNINNFKVKVADDQVKN